MSIETKVAMFRAALAAQTAGEPYVSESRVVAALLRTNPVKQLCTRTQIDFMGLLDAADDPAALPFAECERRMDSELEAKGIAFASEAHQATVEGRPLDPAIKPAFDTIFEQHGHLGMPPLELLRIVLRPDGPVAQRLGTRGLSLMDFQ